MKISIKKGSNRLDNMIAELMKADKQWVKVGHFQEQGMHYSGYSYVELLRRWHNADQYFKGSKPKRILVVTAFALRGLNLPSVSQVRDKWFADRDTKKMLERLGVIMRDIEMSLFGKINGTDMPKVPGEKDTPLLETEDLKEHTTYKTSLGGLKK